MLTAFSKWEHFTNASMIMSDFKKNYPTYLSNNVYATIVNLQKTTPSTTFACLTKDFLFDWLEVNNALGNVTECDSILDYPSEWFCEKNKLLWSIINLVGDKIRDLTVETKSYLLTLSSWLNDYNENKRLFDKFLSFCDNELLYCLLTLTSRIERALGNVYSACGKEVPFLLKDLLDSKFLQQQLGKTQIIFLQLLIGCVHGLNLRNIAWHGFISPGELHCNIIATLFVTVASLSEQINLVQFSRRPFISAKYLEYHSELLRPIHSSVVIEDQSFMNVVSACPFISINHYSYWKYSYSLFLTGIYGDSLIVLMPLLEHLLRSIFCHANRCPERMLTAESTTFYITLDDILAPITTTGVNKLEEIIGKGLLKMLLDLFVYQEGPRLRDKISHAEVVVHEIPEAVARHTFRTATSLMLTVSRWERHNGEEHEELFLELIEISQKYECLYHPASLLKKSLVSAMENVKNWKNFPLPKDFTNIEEDNIYQELLSTLTKATGSDFSNSCILDTLISELMNTYPPTLFRPKYELELISLLRRITRSIEEINQNISTNFQIKFDLWYKKEMKSRVRDNYKRMIKFLPSVQITMITLFFVMLVTLKDLKDYDPNKIKNIQRFFKNCLQYAENGVTMSNIKKNRWNELRESSINMCTMTIQKYFQI